MLVLTCVQRFATPWIVACQAPLSIGILQATVVNCHLLLRELTKVCLVKAMVFPVVMYGWVELDHKEGWVLKNWYFWTVVLEKTLESPLDCKGSNQSILKKINPEYPLEGGMLRLNLQYFGHLMRRLNSLEKTLMLGKIEGRRRREQQRMRWLNGITDSMDMTLGKHRDFVMDREAWCSVTHGVRK